MYKSNNQIRNKTKPKTIYKRSFWGLHKWKIILGAIPLLFFITFTSVLIFHAKIFEEYKETPIVWQESRDPQSGYFVYIVDGIEYTVSYNYYPLDNGYTIQGEKTVWYSVENPQNYILARTQCIIGFSIADGVIIILVVGQLIKYFIDSKKLKQKHTDLIKR